MSFSFGFSTTQVTFWGWWGFGGSGVFGVVVFFVGLVLVLFWAGGCCFKDSIICSSTSSRKEYICSLSRAKG